MRSIDSWDDLIGRIYDAAIEPALWPAAIAQATNVLGARQAKMAITNLAAPEELRPFLHRLDPALQERWFSEFAERDPWTQTLPGLPRGFVAAGSAVVPQRDLRRSAVYAEFLRPDSVEDILVAWLGDGSAGISHIVFYRNALFDQRHVRLLQRLAPHLRRALRTQERLIDVARRVEHLEASLDQIHAGVFVVDADARVLFCNRKGEAIAQEADGLAVRHSQLRLAHPDESRKFEGAVRAAAVAAHGRASVTADSIAVSRPSRRRPLSLLIIPVRARAATQWPLLPLGLGRRPAVLVTVTDPEDVARPPEGHLACLFGLTPAEARLAAALAARQTLEEYAERAEITIGTARWTLKRVLEKTGCRRQSELVHLIATSVAVLTRE